MFSRSVYLHLQVERCMCTMQTGTEMTKLKGKKNGLVRFFYLDEHKSCMRWRPSRKHDKAKITIDSIHEVCEGKKSEIFRRYADNRFDPNCCFSIYYGDRVKSLDLVSTNAEEARTWITGLKYLMAGISDEDSLARRQRTRDQYLFFCQSCTFSEADKNGDGTLSIGEVHQLLHKLNVNLPKQKVRQMFQEADTDEHQGSLTFEEFCSFYKMISTRRDLYLILISYSNQKEVLDLHDIARFLENEQKMRGLAREHLVDIVSKFEPCPENLQHMVLGIDGFTNFMRSPTGDIFNPEHNQVNQDMTQPLSNYFIATSHNTYLTGDQLLSQSRVEMYAYVLQAGCRCVEVDCWDGPDGEPIIHHGYTLTSKILFREVIETINKYAFSKSQYPVVLSIENHCSVPQQKKMAEYLREVLQDKLDLSHVSMHEYKKLPSPEILKGKVLVKGKKLPANLDPNAEEGDVSDEDTGEEEEDEDDEDNPERKKKIRAKSKEMSDAESDYSTLLVTQVCLYSTYRKRKTMRLSRALSDLVKYTKSVRVHDIETQALTNSWQVSSLNETVMNQIIQLKPGELVRLNQRQLLRVYPSNFRVDSSNFNPQAYWNAGCHMVAMNYQTEGRMLELNRAKFSSNGNCGYILKPKCMCKGAFNPMLDDPLPGHKKTQLVLKIISGQQLPKPRDSVFGDRGEIIDPFVEVEIIGLPVDCSKQQTRVVNDNGFNPIWEETLVFNVQMPQIALVRFQVWDHDPIGRDFIGQRTVAFRSMMPGYRHVYLEGMAESSIFVHVTINYMTGKQPPEIQIPTDSLAQSQTLLKPEIPSPQLNPPPSPARVRRTLEAPAVSRPPTLIRMKARSSSCPRKQATAQTPMANRKLAFHWQTQRAPNYGSYQVRPIPNGLCLSDSTCSSSDSSTDSLEFVPSCVPVVTEQNEGTLQREMKALFDQKMREIRCKSPLFLDGESWMICDSQLQNMKNIKGCIKSWLLCILQIKLLHRFVTAKTRSCMGGQTSHKVVLVSFSFLIYVKTPSGITQLGSFIVLGLLTCLHSRCCFHAAGMFTFNSYTVCMYEIVFKKTLLKSLPTVQKSIM
uniref:Phosphoinositide phospholipase C n=1 Tax=Anabas testudineus TaxID=64144 RepID=A0A3Q1KI57_ANATE